MEPGRIQELADNLTMAIYTVARRAKERLDSRSIEEREFASIFKKSATDLAARKGKNHPTIWPE